MILYSIFRVADLFIGGEDIRGLQTRLESPETGITDLAYDDAGSLIRKVTPNLRGEGKAITYTYDPLGRIAGIDYPDMRDVTYTYGPQGTLDIVKADGYSTLKSFCTDSGYPFHTDFGLLAEPD